MARSVISALFLWSAAYGCGSDGTTTEGGVDAAAAEDLGSETAGGDVTEADSGADTTGSEGCKADADCTGKIAELATCEVAVCSPGGACEKAPSKDGDACDDANGCTSDDTCTAGACAGTAKTCDDKSPCTTDGCDVKSGDCTFDGKEHDGDACSDGDACTDIDLCKGGKCAPGKATSCDDAKACTSDSCDATTGKCEHAKIPGCSEGNSPCESSEKPGSNDPGITSCVCAIDPYCCETAWDGICVGEASEQCGFDCSCESKPKEQLSCSTDSDCDWCESSGDEWGEPDLCLGSWTCQAGTCASAGPVICDTSGDTGCATTSCDPWSGQCEKSGSDFLCDDDDGCTYDSCDGNSGECVNEANPKCGTNNPCQPTFTPTSNDPEITACVCAQDSYCCDYEWGKGCVDIAKNSCGAVCDCALAEPSCVDDGGCKWCDDGNACNGVWSCVDGTCQVSDPVECDPSDDVGCIQNVCNPSTGYCSITTDDSSCGDDDLCTKDTCEKETGDCVNESLEGCLTNHPCTPVTTPGSKDEETTACVCDQSPYCCAQAWDAYCVYIAQTYCALNCDCEFPKEEDELACGEDADCAWCDDGNLCNGAWWCQDGLCVKAPPVECDTSGDEGCMHTICNTATAECEYLPAAKECPSDGDGCTQEVCYEDGTCGSELIETCGLNHPCMEAKTPKSKDEAITACVCDEYDYCCTDAWDYYCVYLAEQSCGLQCDDCAVAPDDQKACDVDEDCEYCNISPVCKGTFSCVDNLCATDGGLECDTDNDEACVTKNVCVESIGECVIQTPAEYCDDGDFNTTDTCEIDKEDPEADTCVHTEDPIWF